MFFAPFNQDIETSNEPIKHITGFKLAENPNSDTHLNEMQRNLVKAYKLTEGTWATFVNDELISYADDQQAALKKCITHFQAINQKPEQMICVCIGKALA